MMPILIGVISIPPKARYLRAAQVDDPPNLAPLCPSPLSAASISAARMTPSQGYYERNVGTDISFKQMTLNSPTENSKGLRLGSFVQIRDIIEDAMEQALAGNKPAPQALDDAVARGNDLLRRFERANR
jgi:hypothetical protein